jgi:hypothetical protein
MTDVVKQGFLSFEVRMRPYARDGISRTVLCHHPAGDINQELINIAL